MLGAPIGNKLIQSVADEPAGAVQLTERIPPGATLEGLGVSVYVLLPDGMVVKVKSPDIDSVPELFLLFTRKWYGVDAARPVKLTLCAVTRAEFNVEEEP